MSAKATEEGWFWEWRAFGDIPEDIVGRVRSFRPRGTGAVSNTDVYLLSSTQQNVKVREEASILKLKPFLARVDDGCELYEESARLGFAIPLGDEELRKTAALLGVDARPSWGELSAERLVAAFESLGPLVRAVRVGKQRSQFDADDGWLELAELVFPLTSVRSLGIQSRSLEVVRRLRRVVDPAASLTPTSYVEACRRYAG